MMHGQVLQQTELVITGLWVFLLGFHAGNLPHFLPMITREFQWVFSL